MSYWLDDPLQRRDVVTIPTIGIAIALSVLLHIALIWQWKFQLRIPLDNAIPPPLTVKLEPLPGPPPSVAVPPPPRPVQETPPPRVAVRPPPAPRAPPGSAPPPLIALNPPAPGTPAPVEPATPAPIRLPSAGDFASYVEAQRRARGESSAAAPPQPAEDENARATRLAVANLATQKAQAFGYDPNRSGGVFQIKRMGVDYAEFMFYGWHAAARRDMAQLIEVRKGNNSDIQIAVVRKMIEIIREYEQADFRWQSYRLNRGVTLSARQRDSAGLEEFLMREFFYNPRIAP